MLKFLYCRPLGTEIEINSFNGINATPRDMSPAGIHYVANLIAETLEEYVEVRDWGHTHWYRTHGHWVLKPDNSCGIEVCSPIIQGWYGLKKLCRVIDVFQNHSSIVAKSNCSLHVHVDVNDLTEEEIGNILKWWIKCEPVFFDSVPDYRKNNRYCQFIGLWDWMDEGFGRNTSKLIEALGVNKYGSINSFHLLSGERNTLEFRIGENELCKNAFFTKNWIRLLIHFLETAKDQTPDCLAWLDVRDVFEFLGFLRSDLSPAMTQIRDWFFARLSLNSGKCLQGIFADGRIVTQMQLATMLPEISIKEALYPYDHKDALYNKIYSV